MNKDEWGWTIGWTGRLHEWMNGWMRMNNRTNKNITWTKMIEVEQLDKQEDYMNEWIDEWGWTMSVILRINDPERQQLLVAVAWHTALSTGKS